MVAAQPQIPLLAALRRRELAIQLRRGKPEVLV
jgi:hypothetical protein